MTKAKLKKIRRAGDKRDKPSSIFSLDNLNNMFPLYHKKFEMT
ncbi:Uncharacterised protein [Streptococcus pneumoniae]|nr:Uncharacterised protein [Streptococcus pneumoniae]